MKYSKFTYTTFGVTCACVAFLASSASYVQAGLADMEALQAAHPNLLNQWKFEGPDDSTRLADSSSAGNTLVPMAGADGGDINNIQYVAGFDGVSQAYQPEYVSRRVGAGLLSSATTTLPAALTTEAVFQLDTFVPVDDPANVSYLVAARPADRAYLLLQAADPTSRVTSTFGDSFSDRPAVLDYTPGDWYYMAVVASYNAGDGITTVNWYGANLSQGDLGISLLATDNTTFTGDWTGAGNIGVGNFSNGTQEYMQGRLDNVGLTGAALSQGLLQQRLNALNIVVPEPTTFSLLALGGLGALLVRRNKR